MAVYGVARLGVMRLGAARLGHYQPWIKVLVNGVDRTANARIEGCTITHLLNHEPDTCSLRVSGMVPVKGQELKIYCGDTDITHQLFGGHILNVNQGYEDVADASHVIYDLDAVDYTWLLNRRKVIKKYTSTSATTILTDLISNYTTGFTSTNVAAGLASLDEITFTNEDVSDAISRVMERIGGYWYVDYAKDLHAFTTAEDTAGEVTTASPRGASELRESVDLSQVATRVLVRGGGSKAAAAVDAGATSLPVDDPSWYLDAGGTVECGPQRITYTGRAGTDGAGSNTGYVVPPASTLSVTTQAGSGSLDPSASYTYAVTYVTAAGETTPCASATGTSNATGEAQLEGIPVPTDPAVTSKRVYRTEGGGAQLKLLSSLSLATTILTDTAADASLGANVPTANTAGSSAESTPAASTSLAVEDTSVFPASGWALAPGGQVFSYTGRSASSGSGSLTGIPASGSGSLTAAVRAGTVKAMPHLTGIPASGTGAILYAINQGDDVNVHVTRNDVTAQTALAALVGGDGIHETFITDGRLSITECEARGDAELSLNKDPITTVTLDSRDQTQNVGASVTFNVTNPAVSGTFTIQSVTFSEIGISGGNATVHPKRTVTASSRRFSFADLLRQIKGK